MKGLFIWACSYCRSTFGLYRELIGQLGVPACIGLWRIGENTLRTAVGFSGSEFDDLPIVEVGENLGRGLKLLDGHPGWNHLFCVCQASPVFRKLAVEAKRRGCGVGVMCEAPCNMFYGWRRAAKAVYLRTLLPHRMKEVVKAADFFVNYSGDGTDAAAMAGWPVDKILPFGYFPPPIAGSKCVRRTAPGRPFTILATGIMSRHRGADVLVEALRRLKERGVEYRAVITQNGELLETVRRKAAGCGLPVELPGFVAIEELIKLYETCSLYVACGRDEPWGMRVNDALNCGAPLGVSRGMGGVQLVDRYGCGFAFSRADAADLADKLERAATDGDYYREIAGNAFKAAEAISPRNKAAELIAVIEKRRPGWMKGAGR
ncbi:MAG: glycosyltransferase family 4 protein [Kiritimatiellae bacterium]|nr:glycosyltransferase family 4 protein [Kiritimatiellia bacterium]